MVGSLVSFASFYLPGYACSLFKEIKTIYDIFISIVIINCRPMIHFEMEKFLTVVSYSPQTKMYMMCKKCTSLIFKQRLKYIFMSFILLY